MTATPNADLAARARQLANAAPGGSIERKAAGCASVALHTTRSIAGARRALAGWDVPADVTAAAVTLLDELTRGEAVS